MRTSRILEPALAAAAMMVASPSVFAQAPAPPTGSGARSEVKGPSARVSSLNSDAIALMKAGDFVGACPKLEEAVRLAPEAAIGARINLADCYAKTGRVSSAYTQYGVAEALAQKAGQDERVQVARAGMQGLQASVGVVKVDVAEELFSLPGWSITLDGVSTPALLWARAIGLDPGAHKIEVSAPGHVTRSLSVQGPERGKVGTVRISMLEKTHASQSRAVTVATTPIPPEGRSTPVEQASTGTAPPSKLPGFIGLGVGGAALVAGGALLGVALAEEGALINDTPKDAAGNPTCRRTAVAGENAACADIRSRAESGSQMGNVGIGVLIGGGVLAAASVIYLVLAPGKPSSTGKLSRVIPLVGQDGGGLVWTGSF